MRALLRPSLLVWVGVAAAPAAWTVQHVAGIGFGQAQCERAGSEWKIPIDGWFVGVSAAAALICLLGIVASIAVWRATQGEGEDPPPASRIHFLSVVGMTVSPLFLIIVLMSGIGSVVLPNCVQG